MKITKLETRQTWLCEVNGTTYVRTEIKWTDNTPNDITWHLNKDQVEGEVCFTDGNLSFSSKPSEQLEKLFWENIKTNNPVLVEIPNGDDFLKT